MPRSLLVILASLSWSCSDTGVKAFNAEPEAEITSHADGTEVLEGTCADDDRWLCPETWMESTPDAPACRSSFERRSAACPGN